MRAASTTLTVKGSRLSMAFSRFGVPTRGRDVLPPLPSTPKPKKGTRNREDSALGKFSGKSYGNAWVAGGIALGVLVLLIVVGRAALDGSSTRYLDMDGVGVDIARNLGGVGTGFARPVVTCDEKVRIKEGVLFDCTATDSDGHPSDVYIRGRVDDDEGRFSWVRP